MCLIAFVPKGKSLSRDVIDKANQVNPDGIGVMSELGVEKFYGNKQLKRARHLIGLLAKEGLPHAVHWRFATHGSRGLALCHPFKLPNTEAYLMHNGVIGSTSADAREDASDTLLYVNKMVDAPTSYKSGDDLTYWNKVCNDIGQSNKCVVMYPGGQFIILNQDNGKIIDDIWYSNQYSLPFALQQGSGYFVPARLRPASTWSGTQGAYYGGYNSNLPSYPGTSGHGSYTSSRNTASWSNPEVSPFGDIIYWSKQMRSYGFWVGAKFQKLVVYEGATIHQHAMTPDQKTTAVTMPVQGTLDMTKNVDSMEDPRKCPRCMRFKKDPPAGFLPCWCTDEALRRYYENVEGKGAAPSGPSLGSATEDKPAPKASETGCDHGNDNWENCRECIAELEEDANSGFRQWLKDRQAHNWRLHDPDNGGHDPDDTDNVIPLLPKQASEK